MVQAGLVGAACMVVPAFDVVTSILRRRRAQRGIMTADRSHIHHRLIRFGLHPKTAVVVLWGVTVFFGGQMLGFIAPHGIVYIGTSYVVAALVANEIVKQHRKNVKTINSNLGQDLVELIGVGRDDAERDQDEPSLHELIVDQIRREAHHRRLARGQVRGPLEADGRPGAAGPDREPPAAPGQEGDEAEAPALPAVPASSIGIERQFHAAQVKDVIGSLQRANSCESLTEFKSQSSEGWPGRAHVEECFFPVG